MLYFIINHVFYDTRYKKIDFWIYDFYPDTITLCVTTWEILDFT